MPQKQKINFEKVNASLNTLCHKCGCSITPDKIRRIDFEQVMCPECGEQFIPTRKTIDSPILRYDGAGDPCCKMTRLRYLGRA